MKQVYKVDSSGFYLEPVILSDDEAVPSDCVDAFLPNGFYKAQYVNGQWVEGRTQDDILTDLRSAKKAELSIQCGLAITGGFKSSALGTEHTYPSDDEAQRNFHSELDRIAYDPTYTVSYFKTLDAGYLAHTPEQLKQVFIDGHVSGRDQIAKLNQLKANVDAAKSSADLDAISWD